jgi:hypothetical protein
VFTDEAQAGTSLAYRLLDEGFRVAVATQQLRADGKTYPRGTFVVRTQRNPSSLHERIGALAKELGVPVAAVGSAFPDSGDAGVGSESVQAVNRPRVLLAAGDGIDQTAFGAVWFYLEREVGMRVVPVNLSSLRRINLADYNCLILAGGDDDEQWSELGTEGGEKLKAGSSRRGGHRHWGRCRLALAQGTQTERTQNRRRRRHGTGQGRERHDGARYRRQ